MLTTPSRSILDAALDYATRGVPVFPLGASKRPCWSNEALGLQPGQGGYKIATTDPDRLRHLFGHPAACGIGMPTGQITGTIILDLDIYKQGAEGENARAVYEVLEDEIQSTHLVRTGSGGLHAYFRWRPGARKKDLGPGVEIQSDGAYVKVPPSFGYTVQTYVPQEDWPEFPLTEPGARSEARQGVRFLPTDSTTVEALTEALGDLLTGESIHHASNRLADLLAHQMFAQPRHAAMLLKAVARVGAKIGPPHRRADFEELHQKAEKRAAYYGEQVSRLYLGLITESDE